MPTDYFADDYLLSPDDSSFEDSVLPSGGDDDGDYRSPSSPYWHHWIGSCDKCQKRITNGDGIFCANFVCARESFNPCRKAWCGGCYVPTTSDDGNEFPVIRPLGKDGQEMLLVSGDDKLRFRQARNGDFLMTPFQCELCHFRNIQGRNPVAGSEVDNRIMVDVRQANLDAFWSSEPSTVADNLLELQEMEAIGREFGLKSISPEMGPFPLEDTFGMKLALAILGGSLETQSTMQFARMARETRSAFSNVYHSSKEFLGVTVITSETSSSRSARRMYTTTCPSDGFWFERFFRGCHKRMGDPN